MILLRIALLGDIGFYGKYSFDNNDIYEYFKDASECLKEFDYVIGNLETPLLDYGKAKGSKSAYIKADSKNVELLKYLNISIVNISNNHIFDYGLEGYNSTKEILKKNNIEYFGIENKGHYIYEDDSKIALSGYTCYSTNGLGYYSPNTKVGVNVLDAFNVEKNLINNHKNGYLNIASFHCGEEHVNYPNYDHVEMARKFASKVPYVFYGHHPHVIQGIEKIKDSLIAYSLGNFCFDDVYTSKSAEPLIKQSENNKRSFILSLEIENNRVINYETISLNASDEKLEVSSKDSILKDISIYSSALNKDKKDYIDERSKIISDYINSRKKKRDLNWYLKRLNLNSVGMIINSKKNKKKYSSCIVDYINK